MSNHSQKLRTYPMVTIGICVRNCALTIHDAIKSVMNQDYPHELMEVIFVDDGSIDETPNIIKEYLPKMDMEVRFFHHEWQGLGYSRNVVVKNAKGDYIVWVDGDMILPEDHVRKQVEFLEKRPDVGVGKAKCVFTGKNSFVAFLENISFQVYDNKSPFDSRLPGTGGAIFRLQVIREVGGFDKELKGVGEDQDLLYRIKEKGWRIERTPTVFYERRDESWLFFLKKYFSYGYGNFYLYQKNKNIFSLIRMNPLAGFLAGVLHIKDAYKLSRNKLVLILPFNFFFKLICWCFGFIKAQLHYKSSRFFKHI